MADDNKQTLPFFVSEKEDIEWVGYLHSFRRVRVRGKLDSESLKRVTLELTKLDYQSQEPITLIIETGGGDVIPTHQLEDMLSALNRPVDAVVIGECASMGVDLVQMCRHRMILPSARMLVHYVRYTQQWICDDLDQLETDINYFREQMREMSKRRLELYVKRTGLTVERIKELFRHGEVHKAYFSAQQAVEMHLADKIITDFKMFPRKPKSEDK